MGVLFNTANAAGHIRYRYGGIGNMMKSVAGIGGYLLHGGGDLLAGQRCLAAGGIKLFR
ncbi:hypothetical protein D3C78_1910690 [compost metagenome]